MAWWTPPPALVAEALVAVRDPLLTALRPGPGASASSVAASLAQSLAPREDSAPSPPWLRPEQQRSFRRVLAAVRRYGGAVLADPVGSGKTYVALAVAATVNRSHPTACLVPATLRGQWEATAAMLEVSITLSSHEQVSRARLPQRTHGLVIVDESHHYRNHHTRRYHHLARWLVGRPAVLVTATPMVNRFSDLAHQLRLAVRDNALAVDGVVSIQSALARDCPVPALGQLVIESERTAGGRPERISLTCSPGLEESRAAAKFVDLLTGLRLSRNSSIAALIRGVLLRATGSSPAALAGALRRYRRLLLHARDAAASGRVVDRTELRRFTGELGDQLVWWELLPPSDAGGELDLTDLEQLDHLIQTAKAGAERDKKIVRLREILRDAKPTLVFTVSRDTVRHIRQELRDFPVAWCTGERAGIGHTSVPRRTVLACFREGTPGPAPRHLIVTDVAAEGLDLQRAARVVHYDLPWTPMRLEQREGRAVRLGSVHREVEVVQFTLPPVLERCLRQEATLARKAKLPSAAGLGIRGRHVWRWRADLAERFGSENAIAGVAAVASPHYGLLAGFALYGPNAPDPVVAATVGWLDSRGDWSEASEVVASRLGDAAAASRALPVNGALLRDYLSLLSHPIRERLALIRSRRWVSADPAPSARRLAGRLNELIYHAARLRNAKHLLQLERALGFVAGGHTAGEATLIEGLVEASGRELMDSLSRLSPMVTDWDGIQVQLTGLIVFGPAQESAGGLASSNATTADHTFRSRRHADRFDQAHPRQLSPHPGSARYSCPDRR